MEITDEEKKALESYINLRYEDINLFFTENINNDIEYAKKCNSKEELKKQLVSDMKLSTETIKNLYSLFEKKGKYTSSTLYRGTSKDEINFYESENYNNKVISTSKDKVVAEKFGFDSKDSVLLTVNAQNVKSVDVQEILGYTTEHEQEILLSPFSRVSNIGGNYKTYRTSIMGEKTFENYNITLEEDELNNVNADQKDNLNKNIDERLPQIADYMWQIKEDEKKYKDLETKIEIYENNLLTEKDAEEIDWYKEHIEINKNELNEIKNRKSEITSQINQWKKDIIEYNKIQCKEVKKEIENYKNDENKQKIQVEQKQVFQDNEIDKETLNKIRVKQAFGKLNEEIWNIENAEKKNEKISNYMNAKYTTERFENAYNIINQAEARIMSELNNKNSRQSAEIINNIENYVYKLDTEINGIQTDLDNKLKESIFKRIENIKANANRKILENREQEIEQKNNNPIKRIFNKITGKSKEYDLEKQSINFMKQKMNEKINDINSEEYYQKYSVHEMLANIDVFLDTNNQDFIKDEKWELRDLRYKIGSMYKTSEKRLELIKQKKISENSLTIDSKLTPQMRIEAEKNSFLRKNGYDVKTDKINNYKNRYQPGKYDLTSIATNFKAYIETQVRGNNQVVKDYQYEK